MKLVGSMIVRDELHRYLPESLAALLGFCEEVRILDDGSTDEWGDIISADLGRRDATRVAVLRRNESTFFQHEGQARQALLDWTLQGEPTHILAIDADEFISDPDSLRAACADPAVAAWNVCMQEVWNARPEGLELRQDGGWAEHDVTILYRPARLPGALVFPDRALACGRVPTAVAGAPRGHTCSAILHFGWANLAERESRYQRYAEADGGKFHAGDHLDSILLPDEAIELNTRAWPPAFTAYRAAAILERCNTTQAEDGARAVTVEQFVKTGAPPLPGTPAGFEAAAGDTVPALPGFDGISPGE